MRNLQEQVKKAFWYQKGFWPFSVWINCSSDLKNFANSRHSTSNFKSFSPSLEHFFLTVGQNNFGNKIPLLKLKCRETDTWKLCERLSAAYFIAPLPYKGISCDQNFGSCIHYWLSNQSMVSERKLVISYYHAIENYLIEYILMKFFKTW